MRVLHLIDGQRAGGPGRDEGLTLAACGAVVRGAPGEHGVIILGAGDLACGAGALPGRGVVPAPLGKSLLATRGLRRVLLDRQPEVVHAWSLTALAAARRAGPEFRRAVSIADGAAPVTPGVRALNSARCGVVGAAMRQDLVAAGARAERITVLPFLGAGSAVSRTEVRDHLGLAPDDVAVAQLGAGPYAGATRFVFLVALLAEAGSPATALVSAGAPDLARAIRFYSGSSRLFRLRVVRDAAAALSAADLAVYEGGGHGPMHSHPARPGAAAPHVARALALGVPVVAPAWAGRDLGLPSEIQAGCLGQNALPTELARVALPLVRDDRVRARWAEAARAWAARACDDARFAAAVSGLWQP